MKTKLPTGSSLAGWESSADLRPLAPGDSSQVVLHFKELQPPPTYSGSGVKWRYGILVSVYNKDKMADGTQLAVYPDFVSPPFFGK